REAASGSTKDRKGPPALPEAASLPLVGVGLSTSQPPHTLWKTVLGLITRGRRYWELLTILD
ncbi:hypothetical protein Tco_0395239, partial [Tanacetum coccineum]